MTQLSALERDQQILGRGLLDRGQGQHQPKKEVAHFGQLEYL
jgi:hypothetical protein